MVVVIIGILTSLSVPSFHRAVEQSRADMASANLKAIWSAERLYWLEYRTYAVNLATLQSLGLLDTAISSQAFYTYQIASADADTFTAEAARAVNASWNGTLSIDQGGTVLGVLSATGHPDIVPSYQ